MSQVTEQSVLFQTVWSSIKLIQAAAVVELSVFFSSRRRHTRFDCDWSSDVCSSDLAACSADSVLSKSMTPCAVQKRSRVKALTMTRRRSQPCRSGDQRSGWLPYMACKKSGNCLLRSTECTSPASAITSWLLHCGSTPDRKSVV